MKWLEDERKSSASTVNQRLAAIHSFYKYVQGEEPQLISLCQQVLNIPNRKSPARFVSYLYKEDLELILKQPDTSTRKGRRDLTLLCVLYDTGGRVQEIADLTIGAVRLQAPAQVTLLGKGNKKRVVPLMDQTATLISNYMKENHLLQGGQMNEHPVFFNQRNEALSRSGIGYILQKVCRSRSDGAAHNPGKGHASYSETLKSNAFARSGCEHRLYTGHTRPCEYSDNRYLRPIQP